MAALVHSGTVTMLQPRVTQNQPPQFVQSSQAQPVPTPILYRPDHSYTSFPANMVPQRPQRPQQTGSRVTVGPVFMAGFPQTQQERPTAVGPVVRSGSRDDLSLPQTTCARPSLSTVPRPRSAYMETPSTPSQAPPRPARYRQQTNPGSGSWAETVDNRLRVNSFDQPSRSAVDDSQLHMRPMTDGMKQMRRRSMHTFEPSDYPAITTTQQMQGLQDARRVTTLSPPQNPNLSQADKQTLRLVTANGPIPRIIHNRDASYDSNLSSPSGHSRSSSYTKRNQIMPGVGLVPSNISNSVDNHKAEQQRADPMTVRAPADVNKRVTSPSPLSRRTATATGAGHATEKPAATKPDAVAMEEPALASESPAAKQLSALQQKGGKPRSKTSRLRRAFSFGSAADFRKASSAFDADAANLDEGSRQQDTEMDAEQVRIAQKQEEGGIGTAIYGKRLFAASTDNLSVSSTASSASIMIRKMGRGVKRTSRSLVGLFRPKFSAGIPDTSAPEASQAEVSMVTAEAERKFKTQSNGYRPAAGSGAPALPVDADRTNSSDSLDRANSGITESSRRSILGGDRERAEVLAAVRKGILKYSAGSLSPSRRADGQDSLTSLNLPTLPNATLPNAADSPLSSAPSTPNDDAQGQKRVETVTIGNEDYFVAAMRLRQDTRSAPVSSPATPHGSMKRNATFSPRIVFHDTWPSQEYDRRGEIATCNRLTPLLAQQIKEELNTFKMEMEVHEKSKIYTHFF